MCTVSIISLPGGGLRLVTNRDEKRTRPPGLPPRWRDVGDVRAVWPVDPQGGGTWVAASDRGLVLCILNVAFRPSVHPPAPGAFASRGQLIPQLIDSHDASQAMASLLEMDLSRYPMFRMIAADVSHGVMRIANARWDRERMDLVWHEAPACFVSSGLGDALVQPRIPLFERLVANNPTPDSQDAFHAHQWPDRLPISVRMSRPDARTVSTTVIEVVPAGPRRAAVNVRYEPVEEEASGEPVRV